MLGPVLTQSNLSARSPRYLVTTFTQRLAYDYQRVPVAARVDRLWGAQGPTVLWRSSRVVAGSRKRNQIVGCGMGYQSASRSPSSPSTLADLSQQWTPLCASAQKIKIKMVGNRSAAGQRGLQIFSVHDSDGSGAQRHVKHNASHTSAVSVRANQFANVEHQHAIQPGGS